MTTTADMPKWDIALASLAADECKRKAAPLTLDDFHRLAREHAIRFDDIMETMFLLVINGEWSYRDEAGQPVTITQEKLDKLYVKRRLSEEDVSAYSGGWQPD